MAELGSGASGGDYNSSNFYNDNLPAHDKPKTDAPDRNKSRVKADHVNDNSAEIVGIARRVGVAARGSQETIAARLARGQNTAGDPGGVRQTLGFDTLDAALKNDGAATVAGVVAGEPGHTETLTQIQHDLEDDVEIRLPRNYKIDWTKSDATAGIKCFSAISKDNLKFDGGEIDMNATGAAIEHTADAAIMGIDVKNVDIRNMYIHDTPGDGIMLSGAEEVLIDGNRIEVDRVNGGFTAITISSGSSFGPRKTRQVRIVNNILSGGTHSTIDVETDEFDDYGGTDYSIQEVVISGNHFLNGITPINIYGSTIKKLIITGNTFISPSNTSVFIELAGTGVVEEIIIANNYILGGQDGIEIKGGASDIKIIGNTISGCSNAGIWVQANTDKVQIIGNTIKNCGAHGIFLNGTSGNEITNALVAENECYNNGLTTTGDGIALLYTDDFVVQNNHCFDDQGTATQLYGVWLSYCDGGLVSGNRMNNNLTSDLIYKNNLGSDVKFGLNFTGAGLTDIFDIDTGAETYMAYFRNDNGVLKLATDASLNKLFSRNAADDDNKDMVLTAGGTDTQLVLKTTGRVGVNVDPGVDGQFAVGLATEDIHIVDAGSAAASEQDWIEVKVGGVQGYLRVFAAK